LSDVKYTPVHPLEAALLVKVAIFAGAQAEASHRKFMREHTRATELSARQRAYLALIALKNHAALALTPKDWEFIERNYTFEPKPFILQPCRRCKSPRYSCVC
jgi:hypothetical protein